MSTNPQSPRFEQMREARAVTSHIPYLLKALSALHGRTYADKITPTNVEQRHARQTHRVPLNDYYRLQVRDVAHPRA